MVNHFFQKFTRNFTFKNPVNNEEIFEKLINLIVWCQLFVSAFYILENRMCGYRYSRDCKFNVHVRQTNVGVPYVVLGGRWLLAMCGTGLAMVVESTFFRRSNDSIDIRAMSNLQVSHTNIYLWQCQGQLVVFPFNKK